MSDYDKHNKRNIRKEVVNRCVNFVLLVIQDKLDSQGCHGTERTGNLDLQFPRQEEAGKFTRKILQIYFYSGVYLQHREKFQIL